MLKNIKIYEQFMSSVPEKNSDEIKSMQMDEFKGYLEELREEKKYEDILSSIKIWMKTEQGKKAGMNQEFMEFFGDIADEASNEVDPSYKPEAGNPEWVEVVKQSEESQKNLENPERSMNPEATGRIRNSASSFSKDLKNITGSDYMMSMIGDQIIFKKS